MGRLAGSIERIEENISLFLMDDIRALHCVKRILRKRFNATSIITDHSDIRNNRCKIRHNIEISTSDGFKFTMAAALTKYDYSTLSFNLTVITTLFYIDVDTTIDIRVTSLCRMFEVFYLEHIIKGT